MSRSGRSLVSCSAIRVESAPSGSRPDRSVPPPAPPASPSLPLPAVPWPARRRLPMCSCPPESIACRMASHSRPPVGSPPHPPHSPAPRKHPAPVSCLHHQSRSHRRFHRQVPVHLNRVLTARKRTQSPVHRARKADAPHRTVAARVRDEQLRARHPHVRQRHCLAPAPAVLTSEKHTSELQSLRHLVRRLLLEKNN